MTSSTVNEESLENDSYDSAEVPRNELEKFAASGQDSRRFRTTTVLKCFHRERRGSVVIGKIERWLKSKQLEMIPGIADADYYGEVVIRKASAASKVTITGEVTPGVVPTPSTVSGVNSWVLSSLKDDAEELDLLQYGASVEDAVNLMKERNRTKLPLFFSGDDRSTLIGTVTLSELTFESTNASSKLIEKATTQVPVVGTNEKLFDWIPAILTHGFIYGKNQDGNIVQIYTTYDVASHLNTITAMFLRANEIEELLREVLAEVPEEALLNARAGTRSLTDIKLDTEGKKFFHRNEIISDNGHDAEQSIINSFMFSDYMKCIGDPEIWSQHFDRPDIEGIEKERCLRSLNDARLARNTVMHFKRGSSMGNLIPSFEVLAVWLRKVVTRTPGV